jgi:hypothetical protein
MKALFGFLGYKRCALILVYQPPASSTFLSDQTSHQQPASSTFLSEQTSTSHQSPAKRTRWWLVDALELNAFVLQLIFYLVYSTM